MGLRRRVRQAEPHVGGQGGARGPVLCPQDVLTVVVDDLRLCSVKPCEDIERRFCFEVVSPTKCVRSGPGLGLGPGGRACLRGLTSSPHRSCMLQADSEKLRQAWVQAVQASIASAYRESPDSCYSEVRPCGLYAGVCEQCIRACACVGLCMCM